MNISRTMQFGKQVVFALLLVLVVAAFLFAPQFSQAEPASQKYPNYTTLKGGYYYPSERLRLDEFSNTDFDRRKGFNGEIAFGHHYGPVLGTEFGIGYLESRRFPGTGSGRTRIEALPLLLSAKLFLPLGPLEPYGEIGIGAYFSKFESQGAVPRTFREMDWGPHAGVGINLNLSDTVFLGVEGRYRRVKPEYAGVAVRLDGYTATMNLGFRY